MDALLMAYDKRSDNLPVFRFFNGFKNVYNFNTTQSWKHIFVIAD